MRRRRSKVVALGQCPRCGAGAGGHALCMRCDARLTVLREFGEELELDPVEAIAMTALMDAPTASSILIAILTKMVASFGGSTSRALLERQLVEVIESVGPAAREVPISPSKPPAVA